jgi:hypothetical protein
MAIMHCDDGWTAEDHAALAEYLAAHETLQEHPEAVPEEEIVRLAARTLEPVTTAEEKKAILILLAHHQSVRSVEELRRVKNRLEAGLRRFAELAYQEAQQWQQSRAWLGK